MVGSLVRSILGAFNLEYKYGQVIKKKDASVYHKNVAGLEEGNTIIRQHIEGEGNTLVARIGVTELKVLLNYLHFKNRATIKWSDAVKEQVWKQSGIFPPNDEFLKKYAEEFLAAVKMVDVMGVWNNEGENEVVRRYCPSASIIGLESIEPYFFTHPWSKALAGKKVLVVHPFEDSIQSQYYTNRERLFKNPDVLPLFQLTTVKAVQTVTYNTASYNNWEEASEYMKAEIRNKDFDIALIGAGGYGLILGAYIKSLGKKAVHMGGASQILFGIKGKRWEDRENFRTLFNEHWIYPNAGERPENAQLMEGGASW